MRLAPIPGMPRSPLGLFAGTLATFAAGVVLAFAGGEQLRRTPPPGPARALPDFDAVRRATVIQADDLPDAAVAVYDSRSPRIYLNAWIFAQIGPDLSAFLRAHEEGHLAYHHVPERRFGLARLETPVPVLHAYEFAADCYAAQVLRRDHPAAVRAALRFFQNRRALVTDSAHPPMGARADRLIECLTDPAARIEGAG